MPPRSRQPAVHKPSPPIRRTDAAGTAFVPSTSSAPAPVVSTTHDPTITIKNNELKGKLAVMHRRTRALESALRAVLRAIASVEDPAIMQAANLAKETLHPR